MPTWNLLSLLFLRDLGFKIGLNGHAIECVSVNEKKVGSEV